MSRMTGTGNAAKSAAAEAMESSYFELGETILDLEDSSEPNEASRLRARQSKLADAYFFRFIHPKLARFQQAVSAA